MGVAQGHLEAAGSLALCRAQQHCQVGGRRPALGRGAAAAAQGWKPSSQSSLLLLSPYRPSLVSLIPSDAPRALHMLEGSALLLDGFLQVQGLLSMVYLHVALPRIAAQRYFACPIAMDCCSTVCCMLHCHGLICCMSRCHGLICCMSRCHGWLFKSSPGHAWPPPPCPPPCCPRSCRPRCPPTPRAPAPPR